jgi:hypothetical protein
MLTAEVLALTTRVDRHDHQPGFVEIDLVGHEGGDNNGDFASSLTVTDIATGWTEIRSVRNKAARHVFAALVEIQAALPFPLLASTLIMAASSSMSICCAGAPPNRSPLPDSR